MAETKPGSKILRVLILDESPDDAEQASAALRQAGGRILVAGIAAP